MREDSLGDRMKANYEGIERRFLTRRVPTIIRLDGKAFHTFTGGFQKPFDMVLMKSMWETAQYLCKHVMGCKLAYTQSDEISLLLTDYDNINTEAWFDKNLQKMVSISASMATLIFNSVFKVNVDVFKKKNAGDLSMPINKFLELVRVYEKREFTAMFDSRAFNIPSEEVCNYFIWRQQDATRNAIQMAGQANFSHKALMNKNQNDIQEMLFTQKGINFSKYPTYFKRGICVVKKEEEIGSVKKTLIDFCVKLKKDKDIDTQTMRTLMGMVKADDIEDVGKFLANHDFFERYKEFEKEHKDDKTGRTKWTIDEDIPEFTKNRNYIEMYL